MIEEVNMKPEEEPVKETKEVKTRKKVFVNPAGSYYSKEFLEKLERIKKNRTERKKRLAEKEKLKSEKKKGKGVKK